MSEYFKYKCGLKLGFSAKSDMKHLTVWTSVDQNHEKRDLFPALHYAKLILPFGEVVS